MLNRCGVMRFQHAGGVPPKRPNLRWALFYDITGKALWITFGILIVLGIAGCSSSSRRVSEVSSMDRTASSAVINYSAPSRTGTKPSPRLLRSGRTLPKGGGIYKIGKPYRVAGRLYVPRKDPYYNKTGMASWYGEDFHRRQTANGEVYDMYALTAAHPTLPIPSYAYVTNFKNNRTILVRLNDRGPYAHNRIIDLSRASARALGFEHQGVTRVQVRYAGRAPLNGDDRRERAFLAKQSWARKFARRQSYGYAGLGR